MRSSSSQDCSCGRKDPTSAVETARDLGIRFANATVECTRASDDEIDQDLPLEMR
jgi:hypothetical protein